MKQYFYRFFSSTWSDGGLLILRLVVGASFMMHGFPKLTGGPERWAMLGEAMGNLGVHSAPAFWGFLAAFSEFGGGIALVTGCLTRVGALSLGFTMFVAAIMHISNGDGFHKFSHPLELLACCVLLMAGGAGKYSVDQLIGKRFK